MFHRNQKIIKVDRLSLNKKHATFFSFLLIVKNKLYFYRAADDNFKSEEINIQHTFTNELCALFK